jgi:hypothetical protein
MNHVPPNQSLEQRPRVGENPSLSQASGSSKMAGEHHRYYSSQSHYAAFWLYSFRI